VRKLVRKIEINFIRQKAIILSGYLNPIHKGHIGYFNNTKATGGKLIVIVNSDHQRVLKGSKEFQKEDERVFIVSNVKSVDMDFCLYIKIDQYVKPLNMFIINYQVIMTLLLRMVKIKIMTLSQKYQFVKI
jgi:cytidyltransferase-like protein